MRYTPANKELYIKNRKKLSQLLCSGALAVFNANDLMPTNADGTMPFKQNSDLLYLSGIDQEESILLLFPDAQDSKHKEVLFLRETNEHIAIWEGHKLSKQEASQLSGVETVYWLSDFTLVFNSLMCEAQCVYLNSNEHLRAVVEVETRDRRFIKNCQEKYPLHRYERVAPLMHRLRATKEPEEVAILQTACDITEKGFRRILGFVKPGVNEFEIEAEYIHEFIRHRSKGFAYTPIIASGFNACVLHYIDNNQMCKDGDLLLMDVAAEYGNYYADMTRTIPVNGRFTPRQRSVYDAVLRVKRGAVSMLKTGNVLDEYHAAVGELMTKELVDLGLITMDDVRNQHKQQPAYKKYFMHGTSHHLGLDVHDVGNKYQRFEPGMVFTCEPGIYIREENMGIRLENDILITQDGNFDLMQHIPIEAEEIEEMMSLSVEFK